ncbi:MAG: hypothetical protein AB8H79_22690 [Myxococcota bacterium]
MRSLSLAIVLVLASGCVGKARYDALKTDYDALLEEQRALATELKQCKEAPKPGLVCPPATLESGSKNRE